MVENLSLFEMEEQDQEQIRINRSGALDIVKMEFSGAESLSWQELFSGYDSLHAITYSSGISFVYRLLDLFTDAEIIFGCDEVISYSLQEIMAYQYKTIERMRETAGRMKLDLISRIEAETLRFYVARSVLSHEKIYLLSAKDGRKRVIMGSANLSFSAFGGKQRENICYLDGDRAYDWYWDQYCQLREDSTDQIAKEALLCANDGENLEELPIARTIRIKKALIIQPITEVRDEVRFSLDIRNLAAKFTPSVPKPDKKGKLMLSPEKINSPAGDFQPREGERTAKCISAAGGVARRGDSPAQRQNFGPVADAGGDRQRCGIVSQIHGWLRKIPRRCGRDAAPVL